MNKQIGKGKKGKKEKHTIKNPILCLWAVQGAQAGLSRVFRPPLTFAFLFCLFITVKVDKKKITFRGKKLPPHKRF